MFKHDEWSVPIYFLGNVYKSNLDFSLKKYRFVGIHFMMEFEK
jgi:hypothetical protein